jgi:hypothetical protein
MESVTGSLDSLFKRRANHARAWPCANCSVMLTFFTASAVITGQHAAEESSKGGWEGQGQR